MTTRAAAPLHQAMRPCGPVVDAREAARIRRLLSKAAEAGGWSEALALAWPSLAPVFAASPYLARLSSRRPDSLRHVLLTSPETALEQVLTAVEACGAEDAEGVLRRAKADAHLLIALADLGGVWSLEQVTGALTRLADAAVAAALRVAAGRERARGRLLPAGEGGDVPGFFLVAMGKHGADELNYSSDIDISAFYAPERLPTAPGVDARRFASRLIQSVASLLQDRTADGYVFRVDLRLRPDPSSTPPATAVEAALDYYETVGQNWERAAFIKARVCAGDLAAGADFLRQLQPFVWRRSLDFAAIEDVKSVKRQIHAVRGGEAMDAAGADLKLGRGGIREIEFFVQTQQLILGGREPALRSPRTREALAALTASGQVAPRAAAELDAAYVRLRTLEHRVQMLDDEQTHRLPAEDDHRRRVAALAGAGGLRRFDRAVSAMLRRVNRRYAELFVDDESLSSPHGSLVFTGVEDDPETLRTLQRLGFREPQPVSAAIRAWHHGRIGATRSERGRELFTRLAPRLLEACGESGAADAAFVRFARFFAGLSAGVQVQALLLARPEVLKELVQVLAYAPRLGDLLARHPSTLDAMLDPSGGEAADAAVAAAAQPVRGDFEGVMNALRRVRREQALRLGFGLLNGALDPDRAGSAYAALADACLTAVAEAALDDVLRVAGPMAGRVAVVALGKAGSRELTAGSDLDLMVVYDAAPGAISGKRSWAADTLYSRFCQRLTAGLSSPTAEGVLYDVDLRLRPSGGKGPVAARLSSLSGYYEAEAETWELMALTRARTVWARPVEFQEAVDATLAAALRGAAHRRSVDEDVWAMRRLMERERGPAGFWDLKHAEGGLIDAEFAAQRMRLRSGTRGGTAEALTDAAASGAATAGEADALATAWRLHQRLSQVMNAAFEEPPDPANEPPAFQRLLARTGGTRDYRSLVLRLSRARRRARRALATLLHATETDATAVQASRATDPEPP